MGPHAQRSKEQKKSTLTVPFLGPSGGTKNETAKSQNPQQRPTLATNTKLQLGLLKEEEARDILATAAKNQTEDGPSTRRAAIRACKYLKAMVNQHGTLIQLAHEAAKVHTQRSKGSAATATQYRPKEGELPVIAPELTSELLHCLSTLPDPWPLAKITIDMEKPSQWVSKMCRLFFADEYARRTVGVPTAAQVPDLEPAFKAAQNILPNLEARIIEFLSEWLVTFLMPAKHVLDTRAPHLYFMFSKEYWFRELYLGLKVTASFDRSESYTRIIDGQVRCITPDFKPKDLQVQRRSRGETPKIGLKYGPTFKGQNQPPKMLS